MPDSTKKVTSLCWIVSKLLRGAYEINLTAREMGSDKLDFKILYMV